MATHSRFGRFVLFSCLLLTGCATHVPTACVGDAESLGYHDGSQGQRQLRRDAVRSRQPCVPRRVERRHSTFLHRRQRIPTGLSGGGVFQRLSRPARIVLSRRISGRLFDLPVATRSRRARALDRTEDQRTRTGLVDARCGRDTTSSRATSTPNNARIGSTNRSR